MKQILSILFLVFGGLVAQAQSGHISGKISDTNTSESIPFVTVALYQNDFNIPLKGTVSDDNGEFKLKDIEFGEYQIVLSFIGYVPDTLRQVILKAGSGNVNLGQITLVPSTLGLEEVEVTAMAKTVTNKIDRKTYRAADFETARGGTAVDVLNKLPSISVDPDGTVSVRGTTDFMVYLNGKPTQMDASAMMAQIPAEIIEKIEVITIPSARYDAQGKGGIINITTKQRAVEGLSVSSNGLIGGGPWNNLTDKYSLYLNNDNRYAGGINLNYTKNNLTTYAGINHSYRHVNGMRDGDARLLQEDGSYYHMVASGERPEWFYNTQAQAGIDYKLSEKSSISTGYFFGKRQEGRSAFYVYNNFFADENKNPISGIDRAEDWVYNPNTDDRYGTFHAVNLDFTHSFNATTKLTTSALYEHSSLSRELNNQNFDYDPIQDNFGLLEKHFYQKDDTPLDGVRLTVDFEKELKNGHIFTAGVQPQYIRHQGGFTYDTLNVQSGTWGNYGALENSIDLTRSIYSGYADYAGQYEKFEFQAGLRLEYTDQLLKMENPDYFNIFEREPEGEYKVNQLDWFPSLHLKYNSTEKSSLVFAASRRISRPATKDMAPFLYRRHYEVYLVGDPALKPEYLTTAELSFNQEIQKHEIGMTVFYRGTDNAIFRVNTVYEEENVLIRSVTNSGNTTALGAELNSNIQLGSKAKLFLGASLYDYHIQGDIFGFQENNRSLNWGLKANFNVFITKRLRFNTDFDIKSATVTAQGEDALFYMGNAALSYSPNSSWNLSFRVLDALVSNEKGLNTRAYDMTGTQIFFQETTYYRMGPIAEIGISYSLNTGGKSAKKKDSAFGKDQF